LGDTDQGKIKSNRWSFDCAAQDDSFVVVQSFGTGSIVVMQFFGAGSIRKSRSAGLPANSGAGSAVALDELQTPAFGVLGNGNYRSCWRGSKTFCVLCEMHVLEGGMAPVANDSEAHQAQENSRDGLEN
jgi:hypothetical protein